ncbi:unnamed protein product, partial [Prunus brigantina]
FDGILLDYSRQRTTPETFTTAETMLNLQSIWNGSSQH